MEKCIVLIFLVLISYGVFYNIKKYLKGIKFVKVKAKVIKTILLYSEEWGSYFPEEYKNYKEKQAKFSKIESLGVSQNTTKTKEDKYYTMLAEYSVNNNTYYYYEEFIYELFGNNNPYKKYIGKEISIKYNPNNPKENVRSSTKIKNIIFLSILDIIFLLLFIFL